MKKELAIDRAIYLVDDEAKTYRFLRINPEWEKLAPAEHQRNKRFINGYKRVFRDRTMKIFRYEK